MVVRLKHKVTLRAFEEVEEKNILIAPDDRLSEITIDNMEHFSSGVLIVEDATAMNIPLPDITTLSGVFLVSDQDVNLVLNGGAQTFALKRPSAGTSDAPTYCKFFFEGLLTAINVAKPTTVPTASAHVRFMVWGDAE